MKKIGLLSDTHSHLDEAVYRYFDKCDEIWHAGDVGDAQIITDLSEFKPFKGVYGNIDDTSIQQLIPEHQVFNCEEVKVWMTHIGGKPGNYSKPVRELLSTHRPKLFICGHSHILRVAFDKKENMLYMNPGACGKQGFHKIKTLLRFEIDGSSIQNCEVIELGKR